MHLATWILMHLTMHMRMLSANSAAGISMNVIMTAVSATGISSAIDNNSNEQPIHLSSQRI